MLATEADVLRTLQSGTYTLTELYDLCEQRTETSRCGGHDPVPGHPADLRWKHRVRCVLQNLRQSGRAERIDRTVWAIRGQPHRPARMLLIVAGATPAEFELRLQAALDLLADLDEPVDLVLADPPWGLGRGQGRFADGHGYRRDHSKVLGGYVDIDPADYPQFTQEWVGAAAAVLRPGGQLAVVTGPQRAGIVQCSAETAGLTWVSSIRARKDFPLPATKRPASAHWVITVMCRGSLRHPRRVFNPPDDLPRARTGHPYPLDVWDDNGRGDRPSGLLRYDNALPLRMACRIIRSLTNPGDHVVTPFLGSGTEAVACWQTGRRFTGGDVNPAAVQFTGARLLDEHAWRDEAQPGLYPGPAERLAALSQEGLW